VFRGDWTVFEVLSEGVLEDGGSRETLPVDERGKRGSLSLVRAGRR